MSRITEQTRVEPVVGLDAPSEMDVPRLQLSRRGATRKARFPHANASEAVFPYLPVADVHALTTTEIPGERAAVLACGEPGRYTWTVVEHFLSRWRSVLTSVIFQDDGQVESTILTAAMARVRALGLKVGLGTRGRQRARIELARPFIDWVSFDLEPDVSDHDEVWDTLRWLQSEGVLARCRTRLCFILDAPRVLCIARALMPLGVVSYRVEAKAHVLEAHRPLWMEIERLFPGFSVSEPVVAV